MAPSIIFFCYLSIRDPLRIFNILYLFSCQLLQFIALKFLINSATVDLYMQSMLLPTSCACISVRMLHRKTHLLLSILVLLSKHFLLSVLLNLPRPPWSTCCDDLGVFCTTSKAAVPPKGPSTWCQPDDYFMNCWPKNVFAYQQFEFIYIHLYIFFDCFFFLLFQWHKFSREWKSSDKQY